MQYRDIWIGSPNFSPGRAGQTPFGPCPIGVVVHVSVGLRDGVQSWFQNRASRASAQKLVCKDGDRLVFVADEDSAWTHGKVNKPNLADPIIRYLVNHDIDMNAALVGIETERASHTERLTPDQQASLNEEIVRLHEQFGWPRDGSRVFGHHEIDSVDRPYCPSLSPEEWASVLRALGASATPAVDPYATNTNLLNALVAQHYPGDARDRLLGDLVRRAMLRAKSAGFPSSDSEAAAFYQKAALHTLDGKLYGFFRFGDVSAAALERAGALVWEEGVKG